MSLSKGFGVLFWFFLDYRMFKIGICSQSRRGHLVYYKKGGGWGNDIKMLLTVGECKVTCTYMQDITCRSETPDLDWTVIIIMMWNWHLMYQRKLAFRAVMAVQRAVSIATHQPWIIASKGCILWQQSLDFMGWRFVVGVFFMVFVCSLSKSAVLFDSVGLWKPLKWPDGCLKTEFILFFSLTGKYGLKSNRCQLYITHYTGN